MTQPPLLLPFEGTWSEYVERVYQAFLDSFVHAQVHFRGLPVKAQYRPPTDGKGFSFWHVISEAPHSANRDEQDRIPDLRRCERIYWISWVIVQASAGTKGISWWQNRRGRDTRIVLWAEPWDFAVILAKRRGYYLLKTAFADIKPHQRKSFRKEREAFWRGQKG